MSLTRDRTDFLFDHAHPAQEILVIGSPIYYVKHVAFAPVYYVHCLRGRLDPGGI